MAGIGPIIAVAGRVARIVGPAWLVLVAACSGGPRFDWYGTWRGERRLEAPDGASPVVATTLARVEVEIHPNGTFDLFEAGIPKDGTVRYSGGKAFLKVLRFMGRSIEEQGSSAVTMNEELVLEPVDPDTIRYSDPRGFDAEPIVLKRLAQPAADAGRTP